MIFPAAVKACAGTVLQNPFLPDHRLDAVNLPEKLCPRTEQTSFQCNILVGSDCQDQLVVLAHRLDIPAFLLVAAVKRVRDLQNRSQLDDR